MIVPVPVKGVFFRKEFGNLVHAPEPVGFPQFRGIGPGLVAVHKEPLPVLHGPVQLRRDLPENALGQVRVEPQRLIDIPFRRAGGGPPVGDDFPTQLSHGASPVIGR